jgi:hypothetical protein
MVVDAGGMTPAVIGWECFAKYRGTLMAKVADGKKVIPEIYQRYLDPAEKLLTLAQNTYTAGSDRARCPIPEEKEAPARRAPLPAQAAQSPSLIHAGALPQENTSSTSTTPVPAAVTTTNQRRCSP